MLIQLGQKAIHGTPDYLAVDLTALACNNPRWLGLKR